LLHHLLILKKKKISRQIKSWSIVKAAKRNMLKKPMDHSKKKGSVKIVKETKNKNCKKMRNKNRKSCKK